MCLGLSFPLAIWISAGSSLTGRESDSSIWPYGHTCKNFLLYFWYDNTLWDNTSQKLTCLNLTEINGLITHKNMLQKYATMIIQKVCNSNAEATDNLFYTPLNWKNTVNK
jgi:hypothetical protein